MPHEIIRAAVRFIRKCLHHPSVESTIDQDESYNALVFSFSRGHQV